MPVSGWPPQTSGESWPVVVWFGDTELMQWVGLVRNVMLGREGLNRDVLLEVVRAAGGLEPHS